MMVLSRSKKAATGACADIVCSVDRGSYGYVALLCETGVTDEATYPHMNCCGVRDLGGLSTESAASIVSLALRLHATGMNHANTGPVVVAVADPALHAEAVHIAAATGHQVIDAVDDAQLTRHASKALAVLVDDLRAAALGPSTRAPNVFTVVADTASAALREDYYALPAQAVDAVSYTHLTLPTNREV